jgi:hypothetical protein
MLYTADTTKQYVEGIIDAANAGNTSYFTKAMWDVVAQNPGYTTTAAAAAQAAATDSGDGGGGGGGGGGGVDPEAQYWADRATREANERTAQQNRLIEITRDYFRTNGMEAFISGMEKYVRAGYSGDEIMVMLKNDADYKAAWEKRFSGNIARQANGLAELLPAQYVAMEQGYKALMLRYGVPATLFDSPDDLADLIGKDVSAMELNDRLGEASAYINYSGNDAVKQQLREIYGLSDDEMFAYVLDPTRTTDYLASESRRNMNRANVGGAAATAGVKLAADFRDEIAKMYDSAGTSASFADANGRFTTVATETPLYQRLGALSSEVATADELVREQFDMAGGAGVAAKKRGLASQERSRFSGQSGLGSTSLSAGRRAQ